MDDSQDTPPTNQDNRKSKPTPYTTHEGEIANRLREIHTILKNGENGARAEAAQKVAELTHDLEETAWGETKPMDHVAVDNTHVQGE